MKRFHTVLVLFVVFNIIKVSGLSNPELQTTKFCTLSDLHYYNPTLGTTSDAFQKMLASEGKMFAESGAILEAALSGIQGESPSFILVSGDLTKDGEKVGHQRLASVFSGFESSTGIKIFVIPGNHDIMNGHAADYSGDSAVAAPTITPEEFQQIYSEFGFNEAIAIDDSSLSYVAEPAPGIWLFALDANKYKENTPEDPEVGGKFSASTLSWIKSKLQEARQLNKIVIGIMHQGLLEHFKGQKSAFNDFVVDDYQTVSEMFAANGMRMIFTGHYHATDITTKTFPDSSSISDIETGSLASYPSSYRTITINPDLTADVNTTRIQEINFNTGGKDFISYAEDLFVKYFRQLITYQGQLPVESGGYGLSESDAQELAAIETDAFKAHYAGDEIPEQVTLDLINTYLSSDMTAKVRAGSVMKSLWTDLAPSDNSAVLNLDYNYTGIAYEESVLPSAYKLEQNYPNPFNPTTIINYDLPNNTHVKIEVFDILGRLITTLADEVKMPGSYKTKFNAGSLPSGIYLYRMQTSEFSRTMKLILMK